MVTSGPPTPTPVLLEMTVREPCWHPLGEQSFLARLARANQGHRPWDE